MVLPADPVHKAAREQAALVLVEGLDEIITGLVAWQSEVEKRIREFAGLPPKEQVTASAEAPAKPKKARVDTRLADDDGARGDADDAPAPAPLRPTQDRSTWKTSKRQATEAAAATATAPAAPPRAQGNGLAKLASDVEADMDPAQRARLTEVRAEKAAKAAAEIPVPEEIPKRAVGVYRRGYGDGAGGSKPNSGYGDEPSGAAVWLDRAYQAGWKAGNEKRKAATR